MVVRFPTTSWTLLFAAGADKAPGQTARAALCARYWYPVYAFIRHQGVSADQAQDLTQGFFLRVLERNDLAALSPTRGRFRAWLIASVKHHLANHRDHESARKRGGAMICESLDAEAMHRRYLADPRDDLTPEMLYERHFALAVLDGTLEDLRSEYRRRGREELFDALKGRLGGAEKVHSHEKVSVQLGMSVGAVKTAASRLKDDYARLLRQRVLEFVEDEGDVQDELSHLLRALRGPG